MNAKLIAAVVLLGGMFATGSQAADNKPKDHHDCVFARTPQSWRVLDDTHLVIWAPTQKDAYLLELMTPLQDLNFTAKLAFIDRDNNGMICGDGSDQIAVPDSTGPSWPARIIAMHHLDNDELQALSEQYKVQLSPKPQTKQHDKQAHD
jgi:hypothetical protein